jgi:hypothetical protein
MAASDYLRRWRADKPSPFSAKNDDQLSFKKKDSGREGIDEDEPNETPRIIALTDEEQKSFDQAKPGEDIACEVHGNLESDGHFHVLSVGPLKGQSYGNDDMAKEVMQRVMPGFTGQ